MGTSPNEPSEQASASGDQPFDQAAVDALIEKATDEAQAEPSEASGDGPPVAAQQAEQAGKAKVDASAEESGEPTAAVPDAVQPPSQDASAQPEQDTRVDTLGRPFDDAAAAMQAAMEEEKTAAVEDSSPASPTPQTSESPPPPQPLDLPEIEESTNADIDPKRVSMLNDVNLKVKIELGRTQMLVEDVLALGEGSVVELDKLAGDPVDVYVNDRLIARGEVLVLNDSFCVRISEVLSHDPHRMSA